MALDCHHLVASSPVGSMNKQFLLESKYNNVFSHMTFDEHDGHPNAAGFLKNTASETSVAPQKPPAFENVPSALRYPSRPHRASCFLCPSFCHPGMLLQFVHYYIILHYIIYIIIIYIFSVLLGVGVASAHMLLVTHDS